VVRVESLVELANNPPNRIAEAVILEGAEHGFVCYESTEQLMEAMANGTHSAVTPGDRYDERTADNMIEWLERMSRLRQKA
jgi:hypothetical protein